MSKASLAQVLHIGGMFERGEYDGEMAQAIIDKRVAISPYRGIPAAGAYQTYADKVEGKDLKPHHYRITVVSAVLPTYADLVANYGEGNVNGLWTEKLELHESLREITPTGEVTVFLKKFDRPTTSETAIKWADEHNYRLVFPWEREAFSRDNPDLQRRFWILDLGSFTLYRVSGRCVPCLHGDGSARNLSGDPFDTVWCSARRFLFAAM